MSFKYNRKNLSGKIRTINNGLVKKEPIGYCHCDKHKGYLTTKDFRKHCCKEKNCTWFEPNLNHPVLSSPDFARLKKKLKRDIVKLHRNNIISLREKEDAIKVVDRYPFKEIPQYLSEKILILLREGDKL